MAALTAREVGDDAMALAVRQRLRELLETIDDPCIDPYVYPAARLAFGEGDPKRAALPAGAADGLRRRTGLRGWPEPQGDRPSWQRRCARHLGLTALRRCCRRRPAQPPGGGGRRPGPDVCEGQHRGSC